MTSPANTPESVGDPSVQNERTVDVLGVPVAAATMNGAAAAVANSIQTRQPLNIGVVNAAKIVNMHRDDELYKAVMGSTVIYADGMSVVWASQLLGERLPERIAGIDLMHRILADGSEHGYRVFCLGATSEVLDRACANFESQYPGITIAGRHHGYFNESDEREIAELIRDASADVLFVAITSPKKERFMDRWASTMNVPVVHGVGGSFDVVAGLVERAPPLWQKLGLEWLYRVKQEPRRLWKRYLVTNTRFIWSLCAQRLGFGRRPGG